MSEKFKVKCCGKEVGLEEYSLNHGLCEECMDKGVRESNIKQESGQ